MKSIACAFLLSLAWLSGFSQHLLCGLGIVLLVAFLLYHNNRQKQKITAKLQEQNRKLEIEAALERVRSRVIAMRHSDELSEAAELLYNEFLKMGVESFSCGYLINDDEKGEWKIWLTNPGEPFFKQFWTCPYFADHNLRARFESWQQQDEFHCAVLEGEEYRAHHVVISKYAPWKEAMLDSLPPRLVFNSAHFSLGHLLVISPDRLAPELERAMVRFAKVFDLTWRRFLDLQIAEARAREEKIEAGLDRVRAEIASMRSTEDLERITPLVWLEMTALEVPFFRCGVFIMDEEKQTVHTYLSTPDGKSLGVLHLPFDGTETTRKTAAHWRKQEVYLDNWDKQQFVEWVQSLTEQGYIKESRAYLGAEQPPEMLALHFVPFKQGMLYVGNFEKLTESQIDLVQRLADSFAVAYARYEDFTKLEELDALKTRLYTNITHEFRTPLTVILGMVENIRGHEHERKLIQRNSQNLLRLINQVLDLAKLDAGSLGLQLVRSDLVNYLQYLTESFYSMAAEKKVRLTFYPETPELLMDYDEEKIQHVVYNLLSNALKFTAGGGKVVLHAKQTERNGQPFLQLKVQDTGVGISAEQLPFIFDRFYQGSHSAGVGGTGIGLALAKELVGLMGGEISVESRTAATGEGGSGTTFTVLLPIRQESPLRGVASERPISTEFLPETTEAKPQTNDAAGVAEGEKPVLLVVEDNPDVVAYLTRLLGKTYETHVATDGRAGIEKALELVPDIIISDVMMPEKDGYEVCETLKNDERTSHIPIILLTAKATDADRLTGLRRGADAYLMKPFNKEELFVRLEKLVELRRRLQERYGSSDGVTSNHPITLEPTLDDLFLQKIRQAIEAKMDDTELGILQLCRAASLSHTQIFRKLKALTGLNPTLFIRKVRLQRAAELLKTTELNISEIAYEVGFSDPNYFSRAFHEEFGVTPSAMRN